MSNYSYNLLLFTGTNILIYSIIEYYRNYKSQNNKNNQNNIEESVNNLNMNIISEFKKLNENIDYLKKEIDELKNILQREKIHEIIINKYDKTTSTEALFDHFNNNNNNNSKMNDDGIIVDNEIDLIDDAYDYFPCHNFKKQTFYDVLLYNLAK